MAQMAGLDPTQSGSGYWIDFAEARRAVDTLVDLAHDEPDERPPCVILVGQSGMGKTSILREAQRRISGIFRSLMVGTRRAMPRCSGRSSLPVRPPSRST
jgi:DNA replication protein DnaC